MSEPTMPNQPDQPNQPQPAGSTNPIDAQTGARLQAAVDGELSPLGLAWLAERAAIDPVIAAELAARQQLSARLSVHLKTHPAPESLSEQQRQHLHTHAQIPTPIRPRSWSWGKRIWIAAAACLVLGLVAATLRPNYLDSDRQWEESAPVRVARTDSPTNTPAPGTAQGWSGKATVADGLISSNALAYRDSAGLEVPSPVTATDIAVEKLVIEDEKRVRGREESLADTEQGGKGTYTAIGGAADGRASDNGKIIRERIMPKAVAVSAAPPSPSPSPRTLAQATDINGAAILPDDGDDHPQVARAAAQRMPHSPSEPNTVSRGLDRATLRNELAGRKAVTSPEHRRDSELAAIAEASKPVAHSLNAKLAEIEDELKKSGGSQNPDRGRPTLGFDARANFAARETNTLTPPLQDQARRQEAPSVTFAGPVIMNGLTQWADQSKDKNDAGDTITAGLRNGSQFPDGGTAAGGYPDPSVVLPVAPSAGKPEVALGRYKHQVDTSAGATILPPIERLSGGFSYPGPSVDIPVIPSDGKPEVALGRYKRQEVEPNLFGGGTILPAIETPPGYYYQSNGLVMVSATGAMMPVYSKPIPPPLLSAATASGSELGFSETGERDENNLAQLRTGSSPETRGLAKSKGLSGMPGGVVSDDVGRSAPSLAALPERLAAPAAVLAGGEQLAQASGATLAAVLGMNAQSMPFANQFVTVDGRGSLGRSLLLAARGQGQQVVRTAAGLTCVAPVPGDATNLGGLSPSQFTAAWGAQPMLSTAEKIEHTFALNSDTSAPQLARAAVVNGVWPDPAMMRPEQFVNAVPADHAPPTDEAAALYAEGALHPLLSRGNEASGQAAERTALVAVTVVTRAPSAGERRALRVIACVDTSGSMAKPGNLDVAKQQLRALAQRLKLGDRLGVVTFAERARVAVPPGTAPVTDPTASVAKHEAVMRAAITDIDQLRAEGATNVSDGLRLAYQLAGEQRSADSDVAVLLLTDGATLSGGALSGAEAITKPWHGSGITLMVAAVGDAPSEPEKLQQLAERSDGRFVVIGAKPGNDNGLNAQLLPEQLTAIARDAKGQVAWNPQRVASARLVGYEQHRLKAEDFRNNAVDAAEIAASTRVTALFEVILVEGGSGPLGTARVRYADARANGAVRELALPMPGSVIASHASPRLRVWAAAAAAGEWFQRGWWSNVRAWDAPTLAAELERIPASGDLRRHALELADTLRRAQALIGKP